jgi:hypothetical protein
MSYLCVAHSCRFNSLINSPTLTQTQPMVMDKATGHTACQCVIGALYARDKGNRNWRRHSDTTVFNCQVRSFVCENLFNCKLLGLARDSMFECPCLMWVPASCGLMQLGTPHPRWPCQCNYCISGSFPVAYPQHAAHHAHTHLLPFGMLLICWCAFRWEGTGTRHSLTRRILGWWLGLQCSPFIRLVQQRELTRHSRSVLYWLAGWLVGLRGWVGVVAYVGCITLHRIASHRIVSCRNTTQRII